MNTIRKFAFGLATTGLVTAGSFATADETPAEVIEAAKAFVEASKSVPAEWTGPTTAPDFEAGKNITVISCAQASDCAIVAAGIEEAGAAVGWNVNVVDGKGDVSVFNASLRNATNAGVDGIINIAIDPAIVQDGLRYAADAGIPVINASGVDSDEPLVYANVPMPWFRHGEMLGAWMIQDSDGAGKAIYIRDDEFKALTARAEGFLDYVADCTGCEILEDPNMPIATLLNPSALQQQINSLLARYPNVEYIVSPFGAVDNLIVVALRSAGRTDVKVIGHDANAQQMDLCEQGSIAAMSVAMLSWEGWSIVDQINRAFAGVEPVDQGIPTFLMTPERCEPGKFGQELTTVDFASTYKQVWGVE